MSRQAVVRVLLLVCLLAGLLMAAGFSGAQGAASDYVAGEVILKFKPGAKQGDINRLLAQMGATNVKRFKRIKAHHARISGLTVEQAVSRYKNDPEIEYIEPNYILRADEVPNDPMFGQLWGLRNTGQTGGTPNADIQAPNAWDIFTGSANVLVAIIDTGVDYRHADLAANMWTNSGEIPNNGLDDDGNGFVDDVHGWDFYNNDNDPMDDVGHGTHVSGTVGAIGNNATGVVGVNWNVRLMPVKFLGADGGTTAGAIASIEYATLMGARVMNNSWGGGGFSQALMQAIQNANNAGILFVAAAGNDGVNNDLSPHYPANYDVPNVISVAATDHNDNLASFSDWGPTTVDLAAPGVDIVSSVPGNGYSTYSGTSMATPHVTGVLALILGRFPGIGVPEAKALLLGTVDPKPALAGRILTGGRLNAFAPLAEPDSIPPAPITDVAVTAVNGNWIRLQWTATGDDGAVGTASRYDVRYSTAMIDAGNFAAATPAGGAPDPLAAGSPEQMQVDGLGFNTTYYFAIEALDEYGNAAPISNIASGTTIGPPRVAVSPESLSASLLTGQVATRTLTVRNGGEGDLRFDIAVEPAATTSVAVATFAGEKERADGKVLAVGKPRPLAELRAAGRSFPEHIDVNDKNQAGGWGVAQVHQSGAGRTLAVAGQEVFGNMDNSYFAGPRTRGNIFRCTTTTNLVEHRFYMNPSVATQLWFLVYEGDAQEGDYNLVSASNATPAGPGEGWYSSGNVNAPLRAGKFYLIVASFEAQSNYFNQQGISPYPIPASFGELIAGVGWSWAPTTAFPPDNVQQVPPDAFGDPVAYYQTLVTGVGTSWLTVEPASGTVRSGFEANVSVTFDATRMNGGDYAANIVVRSNDPSDSTHVVPAHLHVTGAPDIAVSDSLLAFGAVFTGVSRADTLTVSNIGTDVLTVSGLGVDNPAYTLDGSGFVLPPGEHHDVAVTFTPGVPGPLPGTLLIHSDDPDEPQVVVGLQGQGLIAPVMVISPDSLGADLFTGNTSVQRLTIRNTGGSDLTFGVSIASVAAAAGAPGGGPIKKMDATGAGWARPASGTLSPEKDPGPPVDLGAGRPARRGTAPFLFKDNFEDGDYAGWRDAGGSASKEVTNATAANGTVYSYHEYNSPGGHFHGIYQEFGSVQPRYISFYVRSGSTTTADGYFVLRSSEGADGIFFLTDPEGHLYVNGDVGGDQSVTYAANTWYHIEFKNLDFAAKNFDYYVNGALIKASIPFRNPSYVEDIYRLDIYNWTSGSQAWWDEIVLSDTQLDWLAVSPTVGTVPPGGSLDLAVTFDAAGLFGGDYRANLVVDSNIRTAAVPAHLHVTGAPDIAVSDSLLAFGAVFTGVSRTDTLTVSNVGTDVLTVSGLEVDNPAYTADGSGFVLPPGEHHGVAVTFTPGVPGPLPGTLVIHSDDPDEPQVAVGLQGQGLIAPIMVISPDSLGADLFTGDTSVQTLTIRNTGGSDLTFGVSIQPVVAAAGAPGGGPIKKVDRTGAGRVEAAAGTPLPEDPASSRGQMRLGRPATRSAPFLFRDNFEDGDYAGWRDAGGSASREVTSATAANGTVYSYHEYNSSYGHFDGVYQEFGSVQPRYISFYVRSGSTTTHDAYFVPRDSYGNLPMWFYARAGGHFSVNGAYGDTSFVYVASTWYHIEFKNIDFSAKTFDYYVNGARIRAGIPFYDYYVNDIYRLDIYNFSSGSQAWWDEIVLSDTQVNWLAVSPTVGTVPPGGSLDLAVTFDAAGLFGGDYRANLVIDSNIRTAAVPAHLHVTGAPDIAVSDGLLAFGAVFMGVSRSDTVQVSNLGTDVLIVNQIGVTGPDYSVNSAGFSLPPGASRNLVVTFAPSRAAVIPGTLTLGSNDPDEPEVAVALRGEGIVPPNIGVAPTSLSANLYPGGTQSLPLTIRNTGGSDLIWNLRTVFARNSQLVAASPQMGSGAVGSGVANAGDKGVVRAAPPKPVADRIYVFAPGASSTAEPKLAAQPGASALVEAEAGPARAAKQGGASPSGSGLEDILASLNSNFAAVTGIIPNRYDFSEGESGSFISDGGNDMYDGGNYLDTDMGSLSYSNNAITASPAFGAGGRYFTRKYPGLFVLAADMQGPSSFTISGNLGADGSGNVDGAILETELYGVTYRGFVKRVYNAWDPSVNHLVIVADTPSANHEFSTYTDDDYHRVFGLNATRRIYYLLYAGANGAYIDNTAALNIMNAFLGALELQPPWLAVNPNSGTVPAHGSTILTAGFDAALLAVGDYAADILVHSNDPDEGTVTIPARLHVAGRPDLVLSASELNFGTVFLGYNRSLPLQATNAGTEILSVSNVVAGLADYTVNPTNFDLGPGQSLDVTVTLTPVRVGSRNASLVFMSNDPDSPHTVALVGSALVPPDVAIEPPLIAARTVPGGSCARTLRVCNTGGSALTFDVVPSGRSGGAVATYGYVDVGKGQVDPRPGILGSGGPDAFGHRWLDSDDAGGPTFDWVDITATGTPIPFTPYMDEGNVGPLPIGFSFPFFGNHFATFRVCPNGWVSFTNAQSSYVNQPLPCASGAPENLLAGLWDDLFFEVLRGSTAFYQYDGTKLIIQFNNMIKWGDPLPPYFTFEILLYPDGEIVYQYLRMGTNPTSATVGIQNEPRDDGLTVVFNAPYLHDNLAVRFVPPPPAWLRVSPLSGTVPAGQCVDLAVLLDAATLAVGDYQGAIEVRSNDPDEPRLTSQVILRVYNEVAARVDFDPKTLNLGSRGRWVSAVVELPPGVSPADVQLSTVMLNDVVAADREHWIGDANNNGVPDLALKFDRAAVENVLREGDSVAVWVTGELASGDLLVGHDTIRVIRPQLLSPNGGETLVARSTFTIRWSVPADWQVHHSNILYSTDDGASWATIAAGLAGRVFAWKVPAVLTHSARVRVHVYDAVGPLAYDSSDEAFSIQAGITGVEAPLPSVHALLQNQPNPFNPSTRIQFDLAAGADVELGVYDASGRSIRVLVAGWLPAGRHETRWDGFDASGRAMASGTYFCHMKVGDFQATKRLVLLK